MPRGRNRFLFGETQRLAIKLVVKDILDRCFAGWEPTGYDLWQEYPIENNLQMQEIKRRVKKLALAQDKMWGYHLQTNTYRICPEGDSVVGHEMLQYAYEHWKSCGKSAGILLQAAHAMGFVSTVQLRKAQKKMADAFTAISYVGSLIDSTE